jgi:hypothetical protein
VNERSGETPVEARAARLFDIRRVIGGLFLVYGVILAVTGLLDGRAEIDKAQGVRVNLWTGVAMLVVGAVFLVWQRLRPLAPPTEPETDDPGRP